MNKNSNKEQLKKDNKFNWVFYINQYPDLIENGITNFTKAYYHWVHIGSKEGRISSLNNLKKQFKEYNHINWNKYLKDNPNLVAKGVRTASMACEYWVNIGNDDGHILYYKNGLEYNTGVLAGENKETKETKETKNINEMLSEKERLLKQLEKIEMDIKLFEKDVVNDSSLQTEEDCEELEEDCEELEEDCEEDCEEKEEDCEEDEEELEEEEIKEEEIKEEEIKEEEIKEEEIKEEEIKEEEVSPKLLTTSNKKEGEIKEEKDKDRYFDDKILECFKMDEELGFLEYNKNNLINILTHTSNRKNVFNKHFQTIKTQTYQNIRHIVAAKGKPAYLHKYFKNDLVSVTNKTSQSAIGKLLESVNCGWIMFLDDIQGFSNGNSLETVFARAQNKSDLIMWISGNNGEGFGFLFHSDYKDLVMANTNAGGNTLKKMYYKLANVLKPTVLKMNITMTIKKKGKKDKNDNKNNKKDKSSENTEEGINHQVGFNAGIGDIAAKPKQFIETYFDNIYVLNLDRRIDRWFNTKRRLNEHGIHDFVRFRGVDGYTEPYVSQWNRYSKTMNKQDRYYGRKAISSPGAWGILLAMRRMIMEAKAKRYDKIFVLQDDAIFHFNFNKLFNLNIRHIPQDWRLLYLGVTQTNFSKSGSKSPYYYYPMGLVDGAFAVGIRSSVYDTILQQIGRMTMPFDTGPMRFVQSRFPYKCFVMKPNLVLAELKESDCRNGKTIEDHAKKLRWDLSKFIKKPQYENYYNPLVSVIISIDHNKVDENEKYIYGALEALMKQSYKNLEILVVGRFNKATLALLKKIRGATKRLRFINTPVAFPDVINMNIGMLMCRGDFITFNNVRCLSMSTRIASQVKHIFQNGLATTASIVTETEGGLNGLLAKKEEVVDEETVMFHRRLFEKYGYLSCVKTGYMKEYLMRIRDNVAVLRDTVYINYDQFMDKNEAIVVPDAYVKGYTRYHSDASRKQGEKKYQPYLSFPKTKPLFPEGGGVHAVNYKVSDLMFLCDLE